MGEDSQVVVPQAFVALYLAPGRSKLLAPREHILQRHEFCEDLATLLSEHAAQRVHQLGITEADALQRVARGLHAEPAAGPAAVSAAEAGWVLGRVAELLQWPPCEPPTAA